MSSPVDTSTAKSYMDFSGLGELRGKAAQNQDKALKETAQQFEGMFIQMMMKSMRESVSKDEEGGSEGESTFEAMFDREVAHKMAQRNSLGLADMLVRDHERRSQMVSTADALLARDAAQSSAPAVQPLNAPARAFQLPGADQSAPVRPLDSGSRIRPLPSVDTTTRMGNGG